ncbi:MAG TPA: NADH:flavin oxidoreductase/NADH oxidase [Terriglobia bacterium]|nr:NADH:flavin oxidoreductase/NADH oxidase [Terriglobia bacterium]
MAHLFDPLKIREVTFPNCIGVSPMCQYSSEDGFASDWHLVHLGSRAVGGACLVMTEATSVTLEGRISPQDLGLWKGEQIPALERIVKFIHGQGSVAGIQLAHAGRKASTYRPGGGQGAIPKNAGGWRPVAPSAIPFSGDYAVPEALSQQGIREIVNAFAKSAQRACRAGFAVIEIHAAHGYLLHEFLSPFSNQRSDEYGGSFENRTRLLREVVGAVREVWPKTNPLFLRISATDWKDGGWDLDQSIELAAQVAPLGVDLIDCSSGGILPDIQIPVKAGYQVPFARDIRKKTGVMTAAVGLIDSHAQADAIIREGEADLVLMAREFLRQPYWPLRAASKMNFSAPWPVQYLRAAPNKTPAKVPLDLAALEHCFAGQHGIPAGKK